MKRGITLLAIISIVLVTAVSACGDEEPTETLLPTGTPTETSRPPTYPSDISEIISQELEKLPLGQMVYNPPDEMTVGISEMIEVRITQDEFTEKLTEGLEGEGVPQVEEIKVGIMMKVRLSGNNFDIMALSEEQQTIIGCDFTQWQWDVTPLESGPQILYLSVTVVIPVPGYGDTYRDYPVFKRDIDVLVNPENPFIRFIKSEWKWLVGILIPIAGLVVGILRLIYKRRGKDAEI